MLSSFVSILISYYLFSSSAFELYLMYLWVNVDKSSIKYYTLGT